VLHEHPHIVFPGNLQGRHVRETGAKGCTLVTLEGGRLRLEHRDTDVLRWGLAEVDLTGAETMAEAAERLRFRIYEEEHGAQGRPLVLRLVLRGRTRLHGAMLADPQATEAECRNAAEAVSGQVHIERVRVETSAPVETNAALTDLRAAFAASLEDTDTQEKILAEVQALLGQVPRLPGRPLPNLPQGASALRALADEAWQEVAEMLGRTP
jgi:DNA repair exonuclease SbcCD nuclease subunit